VHVRAPGRQPRGTQVFVPGGGRPQRLLSMHALSFRKGMAGK